MAKHFVALTLAAVAASTTVAILPGPAATAAPDCKTPYDAGSFEVAARKGVVPDVVCMDLQLAQDKLQAAGFTSMRSEDGTGLDRHQVYDRNWYVTAQSAPAGSKPSTRTTVTLTAVKYGDPDAAAPYDKSRPAAVPSLHCFDLQEAQDTLQAVGFYQMRTTDGSRTGRSTYMDRNWTVLGQYPTGGRMTDKSARVTLYVKKDSEARSC